MRSRMLVPLLALVLAGVVMAPAHAVSGVPEILAPASSAPQYLGFAGPFDVDFTNAIDGTYDYRVVNSSDVAVDNPTPYVWNAATGDPDQTVHIAALSVAGDYTFVVHESTHAVPDVTLTFTVRNYAQPTCSVAVPKGVRVNAGQEKVTGRLTASCAKATVTYASWEVRHITRGFRNLMTFDHKTADSFSFFGADPLGTYLIVPTEATNAKADDIRLNNPRIVLRLDSRLALTSHRSGKNVTLAVTLTKYLRGAARFGAWAGQSVTVSSRACATCAWHPVAVRRTNAHGHAVLHLRSAKTHDYRATAAGTSTVWAPYAKHTRR